jgi:NTE family protein
MRVTRTNRRVANMIEVEAMRDDGRTVDLVVEGGGVKGIGLLGAVLVLADAGYRFARIAGTGAGAIVAALVAAYQKDGRDLRDLEAVMNDVDYQRFADGSPLTRLARPVGEGLDVVLNGGGHTGDYLDEWLTPLLAAAGVRTFGDLRLYDPDSALLHYQSYSLVVHASDLSRRVLVRLPWDYSQYGMIADAQPVVDAVRASMSIPFYFRPVQVDTGKGTVTWVDGGLLSNFPITVFDRTDDIKRRWPTWGVKLSSSPRSDHDKPVRSGIHIALSCLGALRDDQDRYRLEQEGISRRTMHVDTDGVSATDFAIAKETQRTLFESGRKAARKFLASKPNLPVTVPTRRPKPAPLNGARP